MIPAFSPPQDVQMVSRMIKVFLHLNA